VRGNVLAWPSAAQHRVGAARSKVRALLDPLRTPLLPFRYLTRYRLARYYARTLTSRALAEKWAGHYLAGLDLPTGATVLDFGCGRGRHVGLLQQLGYRTMGQDLTAHSWWARLGASGFQTGADAATLPWRDGAFDAVIEVMALHYLNATTAEAHARDVQRVLKPGGVWILLEANAGSANAGYIRRQVGTLHALATVREWTRRAGLTEIDLTYEGYHAPIAPAFVDFLRKQAAPRPLDLADFDSRLAARVSPETRALWLLRLRKP
jgi:SAM-dependent methyltransferase